MFRRALILGSLLAAVVPAASAQTLVYPNFSDLTGLQLNDALVANNAILLASSQNDRRGSFFTSSQYGVSQFSALFSFRISSPGGTSDGVSAGADGLVFVLQRTGATALGGTGEALGYGPRASVPGIANSIAVEFDTFKNSWDPNTNHIGLNANGSLTSLATTNVAAAFDNGIAWTVWVDYNGSVLEVRASQDGVRPLTPTLSHTIDLTSTIGGTTAFLGFTGATGSAYGNHEILGFAFSDVYLSNGIEAIPEPSTYALLALGLGVVGFQVWRRRRA